MEKLLTEEGCYITDTLSVVREIMQEEQVKMTKDDMAELEKIWSGSEMYVASNKKRIFGAVCLMNVPLLQELAERMRCSLIIYPSSIHEIVILPQKNESASFMGPVDVQTINTTQVPREEWLSNSVYRYNWEKQEVTVYKEGEPLI